VVVLADRQLADGQAVAHIHRLAVTMALLVEGIVEFLIQLLRQEIKY
jgi:hypothetical protein